MALARARTTQQASARQLLAPKNGPTTCTRLAARRAAAVAALNEALAAADAAPSSARSLLEAAVGEHAKLGTGSGALRTARERLDALHNHHHHQQQTQSEVALRAAMERAQESEDLGPLKTAIADNAEAAAGSA
eukprot:6618701-Prymnesium_polylepis.1